MNTSIVNYFKRTSLAFPDNIALEYASQNFTYTELAHSAYNIANAERLKNSSGLPVVIFIEKSMKAVVSILATLMTANVYCPVDVNAPIERIQKIIDSLGDCIILHTSSTSLKLEQLSARSEIVSFINVDPFFEIQQEKDLTQLWQQITTDISSVTTRDPCYIIFTSGSTGTPKGVTICHENVFDQIEWANSQYKITADDNFGSQAPFFFDCSTFDIYLVFSNGAKLTIIPDLQFVFPQKLVEYLIQKEITTFLWVPSLLVNIANLDLLKNNKLPALRNVFFAGELIPAKHIKYWLKHHPDAKYANLYGPTEATVNCTFFDVPNNWDGASLPIGVACNNTGILILDENDKAADSGELCVTGSRVALGYWNDTEKSEKTFVQNPLQNNYRDIIYRTGDLVNLVDGLIYFLGRKDFQIKRNGYRIELGEIESVVSSLNEVQICIAGYLADSKTLYLAVKTGVSISNVEFKKLLISILPKYMVPSYVRFFKEFPLTGSGKINRLAINKTIKNEL